MNTKGKWKDVIEKYCIEEYVGIELWNIDRGA